MQDLYIGGVPAGYSKNDIHDSNSFGTHQDILIKNEIYEMLILKKNGKNVGGSNFDSSAKDLKLLSKTGLVTEKALSIFKQKAIRNLINKGLIDEQ